MELRSKVCVRSNVLQGASSIYDGDESSVPKPENSNGNEALSPDVPAEAQFVESEQNTYASANNDLKGTKAYREADVLGFYNLVMAIIDYRGHKVEAQVHSLIFPS
ncbi:clustered mitochondria protein [Forsythia ovata]|uniref:Clustered mitochondria protein n=1 Tax=Forsythia ovata TaxID=205694 RepID=A0ABD1SME4_9LAMI